MIDVKTIENKYGIVELNLNKKIFLPLGLLGMQEYKEFCLLNIPNSENIEFKLFQSVDDDEVYFVVLPYDVLSRDDIYDQKDIDNLCSELKIDKNNMVILNILNVIRNDDGDKIKVINTQAPIIINVDSFEGLQYVFYSKKYKLRQEI